MKRLVLPRPLLLNFSKPGPNPPFTVSTVFAVDFTGQSGARAEPGIARRALSDVDTDPWCILFVSLKCAMRRIYCSNFPSHREGAHSSSRQACFDAPLCRTTEAMELCRRTFKTSATNLTVQGNRGHLNWLIGSRTSDPVAGRAPESFGRVVTWRGGAKAGWPFWHPSELQPQSGPGVATGRWANKKGAITRDCIIGDRRLCTRFQPGNRRAGECRTNPWSQPLQKYRRAIRVRGLAVVSVTVINDSGSVSAHICLFRWRPPPQNVPLSLCVFPESGIVYIKGVSLHHLGARK